MNQRITLVRWRKTSLWGPPLFYMALIFLVSGRSRIALCNHVSDKWLHFLAYQILTILFLRAFHQGIGRPFRAGATILAIGATCAYGALDEFHQTFVPGRFGSAADFVADCAGAIVATGTVMAWKRWTRVRNSFNGG